jgi:hypothetical protein
MSNRDNLSDEMAEMVNKWLMPTPSSCGRHGPSSRSGAVNRHIRSCDSKRLEMDLLMYQWSDHRFLVTARSIRRRRSRADGWGLAATSSPSANFTPRISFGNWLLPSRRRQLFLGGFNELEDHRERGSVRQAALRSDRAVAHGCERAFDGIHGPQVLPVFGGEVVESQQHIAILGQAFGGFLVLDPVALDESIECSLSAICPLCKGLPKPDRWPDVSFSDAEIASPSIC